MLIEKGNLNGKRGIVCGTGCCKREEDRGKEKKKGGVKGRTMHSEKRRRGVGGGGAVKSNWSCGSCGNVQKQIEWRIK